MLLSLSSSTNRDFRVETTALTVLGIVGHISIALGIVGLTSWME